jgi:sugar lactone lactonase YvrE
VPSEGDAPLRRNSARDSRLHAPAATLLGRIRLPELCANLAFGGPKRDRLFMVASQSLGVIQTKPNHQSSVSVLGEKSARERRSTGGGVSGGDRGDNTRVDA